MKQVNEKHILLVFQAEQAIKAGWLKNASEGDLKKYLNKGGPEPTFNLEGLTQYVNEHHKTVRGFFDSEEEAIKGLKKTQTQKERVLQEGRLYTQPPSLYMIIIADSTDRTVGEIRCARLSTSMCPKTDKAEDPYLFFMSKRIVYNKKACSEPFLENIAKNVHLTNNSHTKEKTAEEAATAVGTEGSDISTVYIPYSIHPRYPEKPWLTMEYDGSQDHLAKIKIDFDALKNYLNQRGIQRNNNYPSLEEAKNRLFNFDAQHHPIIIKAQVKKESGKGLVIDDVLNVTALSSEVYPGPNANLNTFLIDPDHRTFINESIEQPPQPTTLTHTNPEKQRGCFLYPSKSLKLAIGLGVGLSVLGATGVILPITQGLLANNLGAGASVIALGALCVVGAIVAAFIYGKKAHRLTTRYYNILVDEFINDTTVEEPSPPKQQTTS